MSARTGSGVFAPIARLLGYGGRSQAYVVAQPQQPQAPSLIPEPELGQTLPDLNGLGHVIEQLKGFDWLPFIQQVGEQEMAHLHGPKGFANDALSRDDVVIECALRLLCYYFLGGASPKTPDPGEVAPELLQEYVSTHVAIIDESPVLKRFLIDGAKTPPYLSDDQRQKAGDTSVLDPRVKTHLVGMYLRVLELIKAILVRLCRDEDATITPAAASAYALAVRAWNQVLGQLDCLRCVLVRGHDRGFIDLSQYPREWGAMIDETVGYIHECAEHVRRIEQSTIPLRQDELQRELAMDEVRKRYDARIQTLHAAQAERVRLQQELARAQDVRRWLTWYANGETNRILGTPYRNTQ